MSPGNTYVTNSSHHPPLCPAFQPVSNPVNSAPVPAMSSQLLQEDAVGDIAKALLRRV